MVYFEEYRGLSVMRSVLFGVGVSINIVGVLVLAVVPPVTVTVFEEVVCDQGDVLVEEAVEPYVSTRVTSPHVGGLWVVGCGLWAVGVCDC